MEKSNADGGGIGWFEDGKNRYVKGITALEMMLLIATKNIQLPFVVHFRLASVGGHGKQLTHPFVVDTRHQGAMSGTTPLPLLFHNGHISGWEDWALPLTVRNDFPKGRISDTRVLAYLTALSNGKCLQLLGSTQKVVVMENQKVVTYGGFTKDANTGALYSNTYWDRPSISYNYPLHRAGKKAEDMGFDWNDADELFMRSYE